MTTIRIRNSVNEDDILRFPVTHEQLSLDDLRSAFPLVNSLRYKDSTEDEQHHIICKDGLFQSPEGGWNKEGREYFAICGLSARAVDRQSQFETFRRQISSRSRQQLSPRPSLNSGNVRRHAGRSESPTTMLTIGHGRFRNGRFSKISESNMSLGGGIVVVGPFSKTETAPSSIKDHAFTKFKEQQQVFRRRYRTADEFVLVYKDGTEVKSLPDGSADFSIKGYRDYLDPKGRYDRLRLFLCHKGNFDQPIDIITDESSDDDDLPPLRMSTPRSIPRESTPSGSMPSPIPTVSDFDDTIHVPLSPIFVIDCVFHLTNRVISQSFPHNSASQVLFVFMDQQLMTAYTLTTGDRVITNDLRLSELVGEDRNILNVKVILSDPETTHDDAVPGDYEANTAIKKIVDNALTKIGSTEEPTALLKAYRDAFLRGRTLDVGNNVTISGQTTEIFVGRSSIWDDSLSELTSAINLRFPLKVQFYGEMAEDYGGPRREFFRLCIGTIRSSMVGTDNDVFRLVKKPSYIADHSYFVAGLIIGLSAIEGGPCADFLDSLMHNWQYDEECYQMFQRGLERTGIWQMLESKPTLRYLFRSRSGKLTVSRLLHLLRPSLSEIGSNRRQREEKTYSLFVKYVRELAAGKHEPLAPASVLQFVTGSPEEPILGFDPEPSLVFAETGIFPTASTCINRLVLPTSDLSQEETFNHYTMAFSSDFFGLG